MWWSSGARVLTCIATTWWRRSASPARIAAAGCARRGRSAPRSGGCRSWREWLAAFGVTLVGMEATGVYWKPVFQVLEDRFECWLLNAQHLRNVPGRKTDVKDSEWICELVAHGLVRPSFVPPPEIRRLRDLTRLRKAQINERTRAIQRLEKVLQDAGIKLTSVASADLLEVRAGDARRAALRGH